ATTAPPTTAIPPSATVAPPAVAIVPTATPLPPTAPPAALSPNQIAATAIAGSIGEQCVASGPTPAKGFVGAPAIGKVLFAQRGCSACHGDQAQGLVGPKLAGTTLSFEAVLHQLRMPRGVMQRYLPSDQSDADECNVYIYVKGLKP
ncbi:MAG TPA: cytochrome c, partial [Chloroflexota bacterium]